MALKQRRCLEQVTLMTVHKEAGGCWSHPKLFLARRAQMFPGSMAEPRSHASRLNPSLPAQSAARHQRMTCVRQSASLLFRRAVRPSDKVHVVATYDWTCKNAHHWTSGDSSCFMGGTMIFTEQRHMTGA